MNEEPRFLYLNRDNRWKGFQCSGLRLDKDGTLRLAAVPLLEGEAPAALATLPSPTAPAGIAVTPDGSTYFSDPLQHRIMKSDGCSLRQSGVPCMGDKGDQPTQFREPRGLLYHSGRRALFVVDSGNHRIQLFDPVTCQLLDIWGEQGSEPGSFQWPWTLASDTEGNVYVIDHGNQRAQKFDLRGKVMPGFWDNLKDAGLKQPADIAVSGTNEVFILDSAAGQIFVTDGNGNHLRTFALQVGTKERLTQPMGIAAGQETVYVGDNERGGVFAFTLEGKFIGAAIGYKGPVAALSFDLEGRLLVHGGSDQAPVRMAVAQAYVRSGSMWGGPFKNLSPRAQEWHRITASVEPLPAGAHLQLFVFTSYVDLAPPHWDSQDPNTFVELSEYLLNPTTDRWIRMPLNVGEGMVPATVPDPTDPRGWKPLNYVWLGVEFGGEGLSSPALSQIRIDFNYETYLRHLPGVYQEDPQSRRFLGRFLSLFDSLFGEVEGELAKVPALFDHEAVPSEWIAWLGAWLAVELKEDWDDRRKRQAIAGAFDSYAKRGTTEGMRAALRRLAGVDARVEEPILNAAWWSLPTDEQSPPLETANAILGFTTMLAPAEAQGAVAGTTAVLGRSHLIAEEDFGAPLFTETAHRFLVRVYRGQVNTPQQQDHLRAIIDNEKPAHTAYHLCVIEPSMRIGFQASIGIDTIVAAPPSPTRLGDAGELILGGAKPWRIGEQSHLGQTTLLGNT